MKQYNEPTKS